MKETWLYKELDFLHKRSSIREDYSSSGSLELLINFIIAPILGILLFLTGVVSIVLLPLYLIKDLYDLYCYLNAEKIAKKEAIKKALKLKNDIENWINNYQIRLNNITPYMLEKITYEEKPKVEQLPGINTSRYKSYSNIKVIKKSLPKEFINSKHSTFQDFIIEFFNNYNNECNTITHIYNKIICDTNRRRSLHDIYLITKYYYPEVDFIDIIKTILSLLKIGVICGSYCSTVNKYVFYTPNVSQYNSFNHHLEFTNELNFINLKEYIENEQ